MRLALYGYEDGLPGGLLSTSASRLELLQKHVQAWGGLDWVEERILIPKPTAYEYLQGVFAVGNARSLTFVELPSRIASTPARIWVVPDVGFNVEQFTFDRNQDLIAAAEMCVCPTFSLRTTRT